MADEPRVYFDNNATTPLDPRVRDAMIPWLGADWGNPSSLHGWGQRARAAVEEARRSLGWLLEAEPAQLVFTASGTEANNMVLRHVAGEGRRGAHMVISALEHPSITVLAEALSRHGVEVAVVAPGADGVVDAEAFAEAMRADTAMACLMLANNELGTLQPVTDLAEICRARGVWLHCDAVQAVGKIEVSVESLGVDSLTVAAHKFHGPLGAAALWLRDSADLDPLLHGGSQERRRRAGTENVAALVGFGAIAEIARRALPERHRQLLELRSAFESGLAASGDLCLHCGDAPRLPHTSHFAALGVDAESLLIRLDLAGFGVSTGSACASGSLEISPALRALGLSADEARSSLRVSFGMQNRLEEVERLLVTLHREVATLRSLTGPASQPVGVARP